MLGERYIWKYVIRLSAPADPWNHPLHPIGQSGSDVRTLLFFTKHAGGNYSHLEFNWWDALLTLQMARFPQQGMAQYS